MKGVTIGLLVLLFVSILAPQSLSLMLLEDGTVIMSLDVCSAQTGYAKSTLDLPFIISDSTGINNLCLLCFKDPYSPRLPSLILPDRMEHPPRV